MIRTPLPRPRPRVAGDSSCRRPGGRTGRRPGGGERRGGRTQDRDGGPRAPEGLRQFHREPDHDPAKQARAGKQAGARPEGHRGRGGRRSEPVRLRPAAKRQGNRVSRPRPQDRAGRPVALSSGAEAGQAHQLLETVRFLHGERVLVRGHGRRRGREIQASAPARGGLRQAAMHRSGARPAQPGFGIFPPVDLARPRGAPHLADPVFRTAGKSSSRRSRSRITRNTSTDSGGAASSP